MQSHDSQLAMFLLFSALRDKELGVARYSHSTRAGGDKVEIWYEDGERLEGGEVPGYEPGWYWCNEDSEEDYYPHGPYPTKKAAKAAAEVA